MSGINAGLAKVVKETDFALLVSLDADDGREYWVPKSQIHDDSEVFKEGQVGDIIVSSWYAEQKGWI